MVVKPTADLADIFCNRQKSAACRIDELGGKKMTVDMHIKDLIMTADEYLTGALPEIHKLIEEYYAGATKSTWEKFEQLLEGLQWIHFMLAEISKQCGQLEQFKGYAMIDLQQPVLSLEEAVRNQDQIFMADVIHYEIVPQLENLHEQVKLTLASNPFREELH